MAYKLTLHGGRETSEKNGGQERRRCNPVVAAAGVDLHLHLTVPVLAILIFCDYYYDGRIVAALTRAESPIVPTGKNAFVAVTQHVVAVHRILLIIGAALFALLPVYSKLLRKINTSIEVAENKDMGTIDISGEDA